jgi:hypothetical protein
MDVKMKPSFVRMRKRWRAVLVVPNHLYDLAPHLRRKNFYPIVLPASVLDQQQKELLLPHHTLITDKPEEFDVDDVPVLEFSLIDITLVKADEGAIADMISGAWTKFRLKTEGWFVLRLRQDGQHQIEFPERASPSCAVIFNKSWSSVGRRGSTSQAINARREWQMDLPTATAGSTSFGGCAKTWSRSLRKPRMEPDARSKSCKSNKNSA